MGFFPATGIGSGTGGSGKASVSTGSSQGSSGSGSGSGSGGGKSEIEENVERTKAKQQAYRQAVEIAKQAGYRGVRAELAARAIVEGKTPGAVTAAEKAGVTQDPNFIRAFKEGRAEEYIRQQQMQTRTKEVRAHELQKPMTVTERVVAAVKRPLHSEISTAWRPKRQKTSDRLIELSGGTLRRMTPEEKAEYEATKRDPTVRSKTVTVLPGGGEGVQIERDVQTGKTRTLQSPALLDVSKLGGSVKVTKRSEGSPIITDIDAPAEFYKTTKTDYGKLITPLPISQLSVSSRRKLIQKKYGYVPSVAVAESPKDIIETLSRERDMLKQRAQVLTSGSARSSMSDNVKGTLYHGAAMFKSVEIGVIQAGRFAKEHPIQTTIFLGGIAASTALPQFAPAISGTKGFKAAVNLGTVALGAYTGYQSTKAVKYIEQSPQPIDTTIEVAGQFATAAVVAKAVAIGTPGAIKSVKSVGNELKTSGQIYQDTVTMITRGRVQGQKVQATTISTTTGKRVSTTGQVGDIRFITESSPKQVTTQVLQRGKEIGKISEMPPPHPQMREYARQQSVVGLGDVRSETIRSQARRVREIPVEGRIPKTRVVDIEADTKLQIYKRLQQDQNMPVFKADVRTPSREQVLSPRAKSIIPRVREEISGKRPDTVTTRTGTIRVREYEKFNIVEDVKFSKDLAVDMGKLTGQVVKEIAEPFIPRRMLASKRGTLGGGSGSRLRSPELKIESPSVVTKKFGRYRSSFGQVSPVNIAMVENVLAMQPLGRTLAPFPVTGFKQQVSRGIASSDAAQGQIKSFNIAQSLIQAQRVRLDVAQPQKVSEIATQEFGFSQKSISDVNRPTPLDFSYPSFGVMPPLAGSGLKPPGVGSPSFPLGGGDPFSFNVQFKGQQRKGYSPTLKAAVFQDVGTPTKIGVVSGLGSRPFLAKKRKL